MHFTRFTPKTNFCCKLVTRTNNGTYAHACAYSKRVRIHARRKVACSHTPCLCSTRDSDAALRTRTLGTTFNHVCAQVQLDCVRSMNPHAWRNRNTRLFNIAGCLNQVEVKENVFRIKWRSSRAHGANAYQVGRAMTKLISTGLVPLT